MTSTSPPTKPPKEEFAFINTTGNPAKLDREASKTVKSHVMRRIRGESKEARLKYREAIGKRVVVPYFTRGYVGGGEKIADGNGNGKVREGRVESERVLGSGSRGVVVREEEENTARDTDEKVEQEKVVARPSPKSSNAWSEWKRCSSLATMDGMLNPFEVMPIPVSARVIMLLSTNYTTVNRTSVHADPHFKSYYIDDAAALYMAIAYAASRYYTRTGQTKNTNEVPYYFSKALAKVNENLAKTQTQVTDSTIMTVSVFANVENMSGTAENAVIHMDGLYKMVQLRGGVEMLGMRRILRRMVLWSDLCTASRSQALPRFPPVDFTFPPISHFTPTLHAPTKNPYLLLLSENLINTAIQHNRTEILRILQSLHELSTFLNAMPSMQELPTEVAYPDRVYVVEREVLVLLAEQNVDRSGETAQNNERDKDVDIIYILHYASLLYIYTNLRQTPTGGELRNAIATRLRKRLSSVDLRALMDVYPVEMMWVMCLEIYTAGNDEGRNWYKSVFAELELGMRGFGSWREVVMRSEGMPVFELVFEKGLEVIWEEFVSVGVHVEVQVQ